MKNLKGLYVSGFPGVKFSDWLTSLTNIVSITFYNLSNCEHLPALERLPCLKELEIEFMEKVEMIGDDNCKHPFPCLSSLRIQDCPKLIYVPPFPHVQELILTRSSMKAILETCMVKHDTCSFSPLSALNHLELYEVTEIEAMAEDWMKNLTSLQTLFLRGSSTVEVVLRQLQHLPSELQELRISHDEDKLVLWKDEDHKCGGPPPRALSSLQRITFYNCDNMKALPEQIGVLQSLRHLMIFYCLGLESLHEDERCLTNLHTLHIMGCPLLKRRYSAETGKDRPKIAHIPHIDI
ncbi:hypothetical protein PIB30_023762 [Stylosanthes scabra]|uniref:R13L1/DRL21-like LRR repeat region domain-containing protein n=1 Tax=Stylosanthes scabra TaxID=79078 RepID=A0ABU6X7L1_9FABA|nr:hypothetical protein [Stylosanthes scabra]